MVNKVFFCSSINGCPSNSYFGSVVIKSLKEGGYEVVSKSKDSDYIIVNTCSAVKSTEKKSLDLIDFFIKKYGDNKKIIVTGCLTRTSDKLKEYKGLILVNNLSELKTVLPQISSATTVNMLDRGLFINEEFDVSEYFVINISEGCLGNCSYCSVKLARGNLKSKAINKVIDEFKEGYNQGYRRFYLIGDDCACYGQDMGHNLADLLDVFFEHHDVKIAFNYLEPLWLIKIYSKIKKYFYDDRITYAGVPIQSGSNRILKLMNRGYKIKDIKKVLKDIAQNSSIKLSTYFIFGFPTETYKDFLDSVQKSSLFNIVTFRLYSERRNTESEKIYPKVDIYEIEKRINYLLDFSKTRDMFSVSLSGEYGNQDKVP